jgi:hypothetical protein
MVASARARPTSGRTRSNAVNTILHPCFVAPLQGTYSYVAGTTNGVYPRAGAKFLNTAVTSEGAKLGPPQGRLLRSTPHHSWFSHRVVPPRFYVIGLKRNPNKEGKYFMKFVDGLANVATNDQLLARSAITNRVHMISIPGRCIVDFVLEAPTFEFQGFMCFL